MGTNDLQAPDPSRRQKPSAVKSADKVAGRSRSQVQWYTEGMEIVFNQMGAHDPGYEGYAEDYNAIMKKALTLLDRDPKAVCSVIFTTPEQIHSINKEYRHIDRPTDVISFAMQDDMDNVFVEEEESELGDIFINVQAVRDQAQAYGHSIRREACFLFCHGLLHLLGYDHMEPEDEKVMFALQDEILDGLAER